jgi:hypothetical protein
MSYNLLSKDETSKRLRIAPVTLDTYWRRGIGPIRTRIGGRVFVREEDLTKWVNQCAEVPTVNQDAAEPTPVAQLSEFQVQ